MPHTPEMQDYLSFMQWLQDTHPNLYICCWKSIAIPTDGEGVTVERDGLDNETYKTIIKATQEFYQNEHKTRG